MNTRRGVIEAIEVTEDLILAMNCKGDDVPDWLVAAFSRDFDDPWSVAIYASSELPNRELWVNTGEQELVKVRVGESIGLLVFPDPAPSMLVRVVP